MFRPFLGPGFPLLFTTIEGHLGQGGYLLRWPFRTAGVWSLKKKATRLATSSMPNDCHPSQALMQSHSIGVFCLKTSLYLFEASKEKCNKGKHNMIYICTTVVCGFPRSCKRAFLFQARARAICSWNRATKLNMVSKLFFSHQETHGAIASHHLSSRRWGGGGSRKTVHHTLYHACLPVPEVTCTTVVCGFPRSCKRAFLFQARARAICSWNRATKLNMVSKLFFSHQETHGAIASHHLSSSPLSMRS